jgi:phage shock protein A
MALLERVATLVRANLNDLVDKADDPEKTIKQVVLDMQNQLLQVKTQVAIAMADEQLLRKKQKENEDTAADWIRRAELAVDKQHDDLARAAVERSVSYHELAASFAEQVADQTAQVESLKSALRRLEQKLVEAQSTVEVLAAQRRRSRAVGKASDAGRAIGTRSNTAAFERLRSRVARDEAAAQAKTGLASDNVEERLTALEREDEIEQLLAGIKARKRA